MITASLTDNSETLTITLDSLPTGATLSNTAGDTLTISSNSITLTSDQLSGLTLALADYASGTFAIDVTATSTDGVDTATTTSSINWTVSPLTQIDLSAIDGNNLVFTGLSDNFNGHDNEVIWKQDGNDTLVQVDYDGDFTVDYEVRLSNFIATDLTTGNFVLPNNIVVTSPTTIEHDFNTAGNAYSQDDAYVLTPNSGSQAGAVWHEIDITQSFAFSAKLYLGSNSGGADGMAVLLQNIGASAIGNIGGYKGIPSGAHGMTLNTYESSYTNLIVTGSESTSTNSINNVETGRWYDVTLNWDADNSQISYTFNDGTNTISETATVSVDLGTQYYVGASAGTGSLSNLQQIKEININYGASDTQLTTINGSTNDDIIIGNNQANTIYSKDGNDLIISDRVISQSTTDTFAGGNDGWGFNKPIISYGTESYTTGAFLGKVAGQAQIGKVFTVDPTETSLTYTFDLFEIGSWDTEAIYFKINGATIEGYNFIGSSTQEDFARNSPFVPGIYISRDADDSGTVALNAGTIMNVGQVYHMTVTVTDTSYWADGQINIAFYANPSYEF